MWSVQSTSISTGELLYPHRSAYQACQQQLWQTGHTARRHVRPCLFWVRARSGHLRSSPSAHGTATVRKQHGCPLGITSQWGQAVVVRWTPPTPSAPSSPWSCLKPSTLNFAAIFCIFWTMVSARLFSMELPLPTNYSSVVVVVQLLSRVQLFALPGLQHTMLLCPSLSPRVCSNSYPLSRWCYPTISTSVAHFCPQSFPASGSFPMSQLFPSGG